MNKLMFNFCKDIVIYLLTNFDFPGN